MKTNLFNFLAMILVLVSCNPETKDRSVKKVITTQKLENESDIKHSARLARIGEMQVNNPLMLSNAHYLFNRALQINPHNDKALFYSAFTGVIMSFKGSIFRGKDLAGPEDGHDNIIKFVNQELKYPELVDFLAGSPNTKKFKDYQDIKKFFQGEVVNSLEKASSKISKISSSIDLITSQYKTHNTNDYDCDVIIIDGMEETMCEYIEGEISGVTILPAKIIKIDKVDLNVLASGFKLYSSYLKLITSYSIKGSKHLKNEIDILEGKLDRALTSKELDRVISRYPDYLVLEKDHRLDELVGDLEGIITSTMDLDAINNKFCEYNLREDHLINTLCFSDINREEMKKALNLLSGPQQLSLGKDIDGEDVNILINLPRFLASPVKDLKNLSPKQYNSDGSFNYTEQPSELNLLFPNRDIVQKAKLIEVKE